MVLATDQLAFDLWCHWAGHFYFPEYFLIPTLSWVDLTGKVNLKIKKKTFPERIQKHDHQTGKLAIVLT